MAKTVLNRGHKDALMSFAEVCIKSTEDDIADREAYEVAHKACLASVHSRWPPKDMAVLAKYGAVTHREKMTFTSGGSGMKEFTFRREPPPIPESVGYRPNPFLADDQHMAVIQRSLDEEASLKRRIKERMNMFRALIETSRTFEDLVEVWPACESLREAICGSKKALVAISPEVRKALAADPATNYVTEA
jgi:hypothetical protein